MKTMNFLTVTHEIRMLLSSLYDAVITKYHRRSFTAKNVSINTHEQANEQTITYNHNATVII